MSTKKNALKFFQVAKSKDECLSLIDEVKDSLHLVNPDIEIDVGKVTSVPFINNFRCMMLVKKVDGVTWHQCKQAVNRINPVSMDLI
jgi:phosphorylcholine metabolism protein LicD